MMLKTSFKQFPSIIYPIDPRNDINKWKPPSLTIILEKSEVSDEDTTISRSLIYKGWSNVITHVL